MRLLRAATLTTSDPQATAARYREFFDYETIETGRVDDGLAASWGAPAAAGQAYALCRPASGSPVFLRFVGGETPSGYQPLRTYGWAAIELCVQDTLKVNARVETSPFEIIGPPKALDGLPAIFPMQVKGPDAEIVYLTEIRADMPEYDLPRAASLVDTLFILVLACSDMAASMRWFESALGVSPGREIELVYTMLADAFGLPHDQKHRIATGVHERDCFLEFDQYPEGATARPGASGALKPGIALATLIHPDIDAIRAPWLTPPTVRSGALYEGRRAGVLRGPDDTLVEVMEA